ncbi:NUDIX hydrolase [Roseinatronobacter monicus]|uniref:ADP-ribose pyrophosphatase n=1 Tax=Roseinatronobacter monicus TaxID=393481 RepID=A0A543K8X4_9RHOB|nr:NUDIX hydrolase [Roseinatronobacter monicus]TQM89536.1 ADP-ribose pyrophosphatase [Roseinatronobacter monicus]TQM91503.1 ADP-ribose pyrophosphatase [Roseinatronobacter monicus]
MTARKTLSRQLELDAAPYLRVFREEGEVVAGQVIPDFWQVELRSFVLVMPVQPDGRVVAMTGYRHGPRRNCLSLSGGFIDPGETPEAAARRELLEEAGRTPTQLIGLGDYVGNGNQRGAHGHFFLARGCKAAPGWLSDPSETATLAAITADEVEKALDAGPFAVVHHVADWGLARRHRDFPAA